MKLTVKPYRLCGLIAAIIAGNTGCAPLGLGGYGPDQQSRADFERRVEAAFRLQNRMTSEVMALQSDGSDTMAHTPIIEAEQSMQKNCSYLNEYAIKDIEGEDKSFLLLRRVENSVANCETSAKILESLLNRHQR